MRARLVVRHLGLASAAAACLVAAPVAQPGSRVPAESLLDRPILQALDEELSGVAAKDHVSRLAQFHRVPASNGFHDAIEYVTGRAKAFGLSDVHVETFPGDGTTLFGTLRGSRGWRVEGGSLDEVRPHPRRITSYDDMRLAVADNSESADVTVELVDVGSGTRRADYDGKDVRGKVRSAAVKGPLDPGGDWLTEKAGALAAGLTLARSEDSGDVTYEIVNFIDGTHSVGEIRDAVSAEFEPIEPRAVADYIELLARTGAVTFR